MIVFIHLSLYVLWITLSQIYHKHYGLINKIKKISYGNCSNWNFEMSCQLCKKAN